MWHDEDHVGRLIKRLSDALEKEANGSLRELGISMSQLRVLIDLRQAEGARTCLRQLEERSGVAQSTMWGIVSRLEAKGLVETGAHEGTRKRWVAITSQGVEVSRRAHVSVEQTEARLLRLAGTDADKFRDILERMCDDLGA